MGKGRQAMTHTDHYWHFCRIVDGHPVLRDGSPAAAPGGVEHYAGKLAICRAGMHASRRAIDALDNAPGPWVRLVTLCATKRHIIASADATMVLNEFSCCATEVELLILEEEDRRSWEAIEAKRAWMRGECSDVDLASTWESAWESAWTSAWTSAWESAWESARVANALESARSELNTVLESMLSELLEVTP